MNERKYRCPHCKERLYYTIPERCPFCKKKIPKNETIAISFLQSVEEQIQELNQTQILDNEFCLALRKLCEGKLQNLQDSVLGVAKVPEEKAVLQQELAAKQPEAKEIPQKLPAEVAPIADASAAEEAMKQPPVSEEATKRSQHQETPLPVEKTLPQELPIPTQLPVEETLPQELPVPTQLPVEKTLPQLQEPQDQKTDQIVFSASTEALLQEEKKPSPKPQEPSLDISLNLPELPSEKEKEMSLEDIKAIISEVRTELTPKGAHKAGQKAKSLEPSKLQPRHTAAIPEERATLHKQEKKPATGAIPVMQREKEQAAIPVIQREKEQADASWKGIRQDIRVVEMPMISHKVHDASPKEKPKPPKPKQPGMLGVYLNHPAVKENVLLFLGIFLILAGEVFVVSSSWGQMSDSMKLFGIFGLLMSSVLLFFFLGRFIARRLALETPALVLYMLALFILPMAMIVPGKLLQIDPVWGLASCIVTAGFSLLICKTVGNFFRPSLANTMNAGFLPLVVFQVFVPFFSGEYPTVWFFVSYGALALILWTWKNTVDSVEKSLASELAITCKEKGGTSQSVSSAKETSASQEKSVSLEKETAALQEKSVSTEKESKTVQMEKTGKKSQSQEACVRSPMATLFWWMAISCGAFLALLVHLHYQISSTTLLKPFVYGAMPCVAALFMAWMHYRFYREQFSLLAASSVCLAVLGVSIATGNPTMLLVAMALSLALFTYHTRKTENGFYFMLFLLSSVMVYFLLPAPIRSVIIEVRNWLGGKLGYSEGKLPFSYYGVTFLPYMIALGYLGHVLIQHNKNTLLRILQGWFLTLSLGLLALAKWGGTDIRPVLFTLPIYGIGYIFAVRYLRFPVFSYFSVGTLSLWVYEVGVRWYPRPWTGGCILVALAVFWFLMRILSKIKDWSYHSQTTLCYSFLFMLSGGTIWLLSTWPISQTAGHFLFFGALLWPCASAMFHNRLCWVFFVAASMTGLMAIAYDWYPKDWQTIANMNMGWSYTLCIAMCCLTFISGLHRPLRMLLLPKLAERMTPTKLPFHFAWLQPKKTEQKRKQNKQQDVPAAVGTSTTIPESEYLKAYVSQLVIQPLSWIVFTPLLTASFAILQSSFFSQPKISTMIAILIAAGYAILSDSERLKSWCKEGSTLSDACFYANRFVAVLFQLVWLAALIALTQSPTTVLPLTVTIGAFLYLVASLYMQCPVSLWCAPAFLYLSGGFLLQTCHVRVEIILAIYAAMSLLFALIQGILLSARQKWQAVVFDVYSLFIGTIVLAVTAILALEVTIGLRFSMVNYRLEWLIVTLVVLSISAILHAINKAMPFFTAIAFALFTLSLSWTTEVLWPRSLQAQALTFVVWGTILYLSKWLLLHGKFREWAKSIKLWGESPLSRLLEHRRLKYYLGLYPNIVFLIVYLLSTHLTFLERMIEPLPIGLLLACVAYAFIYGLLEKKGTPVYISAIVLNQAILTVYFMPRGSPIIHQWPLAQSMVCLAFGIASWLLDKKPYFKLAMAAIFRYSSVTLIVTLTYLAFWRLVMYFGLISLPEVLPLYARACTLIAALLLFFHRKVDWAALPYIGLMAFVGTIFFGLDSLASPTVYYPIACMVLAILYGVLTLYFPSLKYPFDMVGIEISVYGVCAFIFLYFHRLPNTPIWALFILGILLALHALFYYVKSKYDVWAYLAGIYLYANLYGVVVLDWTKTPWPYHFLVLACMSLALLLLVFLLRKVAFQATYRGVTFGFSGAKFGQALCDVTGVVCFLILLSGFCLWVFQMSMANLVNYTALLSFIADIQANQSIWAAILLVTLLCFAWLGKLWRKENKIVAKNIAILAIFEILLWFPYITMWCDSIRLPVIFATVEISLFALVLGILFYAHKSDFLLFWAGIAAGCSFFSAMYHYVHVSALVSVFCLAMLPLLVCQDRGTRRAFHYVLFCVSLFLCGRYLWFAPKSFWQIDLVALILVGFAWLFALLPKKVYAKLWTEANRELWIELTRYFLWSGMFVLILQGYLYIAPLLWYQICAVLAGAVLCIPLLVMTGRDEKFPLSYYIVQAIGPMLYLFCRFRLGFMPFLDGYDVGVMFGIFVFIPAIVMIWLPSPRLREVAGNFSLLMGGLVLVYENLPGLSLVSSSLYLASLGLVVTLREMVLDASWDGPEEEEEKEKETGIGIVGNLVTAGAVALGLFVYFSVPLIPRWWLPLVSTIVMVRSVLAYLIANEKQHAFWSFMFFALTSYSTIAIYCSPSFATHPLFILAITNVVLLSCLLGTKEIKLGHNLRICGNDIREMALLFTWLVIGTLTLLCSIVQISLVMDIGVVSPSLDLSQSSLAGVIGNYYALILFTGLVAFLTGAHIRRYQKGLWFFFAPVFLVLGTTSPFGHILEWKSIGLYSPPGVEWALVALATFVLATRWKKEEWNAGSWMTALLAIAVTKLSIGTPITFVTLFLASGLCLVCSLTLRSIGWFRSYGASQLIALYFLIFYLLPRTGKPPTLVLPLLSIVTVLATFFALWAGGLLKKWLEKEKKSQKGDSSRSKADVDSIYGRAVAFVRNDANLRNFLVLIPQELELLCMFFVIIAIVFVTGGIFAVTQETPKVDAHSYERHILLSFTALIFNLVACLVMGKRTGNLLFYYAFQALLIGSFYFLRIKADWMPFLEGYDPHVVVLLAITFFQIYLYLKKYAPEKAQTFEIGSYILPVIALFYAPWNMETAGSAIFILASIHFGLMYRATHKKPFMIAGLGLLNLALFQFWRAQDVVDPQFYGIPLGLTLLVLGEIYKSEISLDKLYGFRICGILSIYGSSSIQVILKINDPTYAVVLGVLAFVGIAIGIWIRNNLCLSMATIFLIADILGYMIKYGAERGILKGMLSIMAGMTIMAVYLYIHFKRKKEGKDRED